MGKFVRFITTRSLIKAVLILSMSFMPSPAFAAVPGQKNLLVFGIVGSLIFVGLIIVIGGVILVIRARRLAAAAPPADPEEMLRGQAPLPSETGLSPAESALTYSEAGVEGAAEATYDPAKLSTTPPREESATPEEAASTVIEPASSTSEEIRIELADCPADINRFVQDVMAGVARSSSLGTIYKGEQVMVTYENGQFILEYLNRPERVLVAHGTPAARTSERASWAAGPEVQEVTQTELSEEARTERTPDEELETVSAPPESSDIPEEGISTIMIHRDALMREEADGPPMAQTPSSQAEETEPGTAVEKQVCPVCGTKFVSDEKICPNCGVKLL